MTQICGGYTGPWPETPTTPCCYGSASGGPQDCTCWVPVYDVEQAEPQTALDAAVMPGMCGDCAFRPDSPERAGQGVADWDDLRNLAERGDPFWCHDGMRRPVAWRHPSGMEIPGDPLDYRPPIIDNRPYRADGRPGSYCGGWTALFLKAHSTGGAR